MPDFSALQHVILQCSSSSGFQQRAAPLMFGGSMYRVDKPDLKRFGFGRQVF
jgi:hypothetical protein